MFLYLIRSGSRGPIKIGVAVNVEKRLQSLQVGNPYELTVLVKIDCQSRAKAYETENKLHRIYARKRMRGEWFDGGINLKEADWVLNCDRLDRAKTDEETAIELDLELLASSPL